MNKYSWNKSDTQWMLSLYGTAIGAGILFLPINAGIGGLLPLIVMSILIYPMVFYSHRALTRLVLSSNNKESNIINVIEEYFGKFNAKIFAIFYFMTIFPILLIYSVGITNTVNSLLINQFNINPPPRLLLSFILIFGLVFISYYLKDTLIKLISLLVYPFIISIIFLSVLLIPYWNFGILSYDNLITNNNIIFSLWLALPVFIFSFNHSPIISSFAKNNSINYNKKADYKCSEILRKSHSLMVITVLFFTFSCLLVLSVDDLYLAKEQNITILSYIGNILNVSYIAYIAPFIALVAITKSFFGHYFGAFEGLNNINSSIIKSVNNNTSDKIIINITTSIIFIICWITAYYNPSILGLIESMVGPIIAILLYILPVYTIYRIPSLSKYKGNISNYFLLFIGIISLSAILYNLIF